MGNIIFKILGAAVRAASPQVREMLHGTVTRLKEAAADTPNPWDDLLVEVLGAILGFED